MTIHDITEKQPHIVIPAEGDVYVVPVSLVRDWISGECTPEPEIVRAIIAEWLGGLEG